MKYILGNWQLQRKKYQHWIRRTFDLNGNLEKPELNWISIMLSNAHDFEEDGSLIDFNGIKINESEYIWQVIFGGRFELLNNIYNNLYCDPTYKENELEMAKQNIDKFLIKTNNLISFI